MTTDEMVGITRQAVHQRLAKAAHPAKPKKRGGGRPRLPEDVVDEARYEMLVSKMSTYEAANRFGFSQSTASLIKRGLR